MNRAKRIIAYTLAAILLISTFAGAGAFLSGSRSETRAEAAEKRVNPETGIFKVPSAEGVLGTEDNPFVVLEIVPEESMAQFGYMVAGEEPIDIASALTGMTDAERSVFLNKLSEYLSAEGDFGSSVKTEFASRLSDDEINDYFVSYPYDAARYGTYTRLEEATGDYNLVCDGSEYEYVGAGNGDYINLKYVGEGSGDIDFFKKVTDWTADYSMDYYYVGNGGTHEPEYTVGKYVSKLNSINLSKSNNKTALDNMTADDYLVIFEYKQYPTDADGQRYSVEAYGEKYSEYIREYNYVTEGRIGNQRKYYKFDTGSTGDWYYALFKANNSGNYIVKKAYTRQEYLTSNEPIIPADQRLAEYYDHSWKWMTYHAEGGGFAKSFKATPGGAYAENKTNPKVPMYVGEDSKGQKLGNYELLNEADKDAAILGTAAGYSKYTVGTGKGRFKEEMNYIGANRGSYRKVYRYHFEPADEPGTGWYSLDLLNLEESNAINSNPARAAEYDATEALKLVEDRAAHSTDYEEYYSTGYTPAEIKTSIRELVGVCYDISYTNNEIFKKDVLGLSYIRGTNGKVEAREVDSYTFDGWYYEPEGINIFNASRTINSDITLYAKWHPTDMADYSLIFDANAGTDSVVFDYENGTKVAEDSKVLTVSYLTVDSIAAAPEATPIRSGYVFVGWSKNPDATYTSPELFDFRTKPGFSETNREITLYAVWAPLDAENYNRLYTVRFSANTDETVINMPSPASVTLRKNGREDGATTRLALSTPEREGYVFGGWYYNRSFTNEYRPDDVIPDDIAGDEFTVYAKWIKKNDGFKISFNSNKPSSGSYAAIADVTNMPDALTVAYDNTGISTETFTDLSKPVLQGNIQAKIDAYNVRVITVTPADFNKTDNLRLIDRANLIVLNQTYDTTLTDAWYKYRSKVLFSKKNADYKTSLTNTSFYQNDVSFGVTLKLFSRICGKYYSGSGSVTNASNCPVLFDYSIYSNPKNGTNTSFKSKNNANGNVTSNTAAAYPNNLYKLYLLTQQMHPMTAFNAFINPEVQPKVSSVTKVNCSTGTFTTASGDSYDKWNEYTLIPYDAMDNEDINAFKTEATGDAPLAMLTNLGINFRIGQTGSTISNRLTIYSAGAADDVTGLNGILQDLNIRNISGADHEDISAYLGTAEGDAAGLTIADVLYYAIYNQELYSNYNKDLSILEIQPTDKWKGDRFWFWYISRYVPGFAGKCTVEQENMSEFIGKEGDLNSLYDVLYIGSNIENSGNYSTYMPNFMDSVIIPAGEEYTVTETRTVDAVFYRYEKIGEEKVPNKNSRGTVVNAHPVSGRDSGLPTVVLGTNDTGLMITVTYSPTMNIPTRSSSSSKYRVLRGGTQYYYFTDISYLESKLGLSITWKASSSGQIERKKNSSWEKGNFQIEKFWVQKEDVYGWKEYSGGQVQPGQQIKFAEDYTWSVPSDTYTYAHTGKTVTNNNSNVRGLIQASDGRTSSDAITTYVFSGNDLTGVKVDDILNFVKAGYPIIFDDNLINRETFEINERRIDTASNVYYLMKTIVESPVYSKTCFIENTSDATNDAAFVKSLANKSFSLAFSSRPVEYRDRTLTENAGLSDSEVYINGRDINDRDLRFEFTIVGSGNYSVALYLDLNADGKFDEDTERLDSVEVSRIDSGKRTPVSENNLKGGNTYRVTRVIDDYAGAIPWKLIVTQFDASTGAKTQVRAEKTGMCAIKVDETEKKPLYVLQIMSGYNSSAKNYAYDNIYFPTREEIKKASDKGQLNRGADRIFEGCITSIQGGNITGDKLKNAGMFYQYTQSLDEFTVEFFRVKVSDLGNIADGREVNHVFYEDNILKCKLADDSTAEINMMILGFADCYLDISNEAALKMIEKFIGQGKTTLFTHDTTSHYNNSTTADWGYNINRYYRQILGMDRYSVMDNKGVITDANKLEASDLPYLPGSVRNYSNKAANSLVTAVAGTDRRMLTQGYSKTMLDGGDARSGDTQHIVQTNSGQMTKYPYTILGDDGKPDGQIKIALTHEQYYQLDLENDDIVVWYCLTSDSNTSIKRLYDLDNDVRNSYYIYNRGNITYSGVGHGPGLTEMECKLFVNTMVAAFRAGIVATKPEITNVDKSYDRDTDYLYIDFDASPESGSEVDGGININDTGLPFGAGVGLLKTDGSITTDEHDPDVKKVNGTDIYTKRIYFGIKNTSIVANKEMTLYIYPAEKSLTTGKETVYNNKPLELRIYDTTDETVEPVRVERLADAFAYAAQNTENVTYMDTSTRLMDGFVVVSGHEYYADVPITSAYYNGAEAAGGLGLDSEFDIISNTGERIRLEVIMRYGKDRDECIPIVGDRDVVFLRRGMFSLD